MRFKLIALGTGGAFTLDNWHTNFVLEATTSTGDGDPGVTKRILIDCGSDVRHSLKEVGLTAFDIDAVYVSHQHGDHCGGLEWLGFMTYFTPEADRPDLYLPDCLKHTIWNHVLYGGMGNLQGKIMGLDDFFDVHPVEQNGGFLWRNAKFKLVQTRHIMNVPSFGLLVEMNGNKIFITTDTQFTPEQNTYFYNQADVILHDCETLRIDGENVKSGVHSHYDDLKKLPIPIKRRILLTHYGDNVLTMDKEKPFFDVVKDKFAGWVTKGQSFEF